MAERVKTLIIGGGAIGLSIARSVGQFRRSKGITNSIMLIEKHSILGFETSSRSSEVLHAGLYYPPKALKTGLCINGRKMLIDFMNRHNIPYQLCGKLVVATNDFEVKSLKALYANGREGNGLKDLAYLDSIEKIHDYEPSIVGKEAIFSPYSGIFDSHGVIQAIEIECLDDGGIDIIPDCSFLSSKPNTSVDISTGATGTTGRYVVETNRGTIMCDEIINTAGLFAPHIAYRMNNIKKESIPRPYYSKGNYFKLVSKDNSSQQHSSTTNHSKFRRLIYPMPSGGGLGVHATIDLSGAIRFGPDTQWIRNRNVSNDSTRDPYEHDLEESLDLHHSLTAPSSSSPQNHTSGALLNYEVSSDAKNAFIEAIAKYWPDVKDYDLTPDYCGIRPKLCGPNPPPSVSSKSGGYKMTAAVDFVIHDESIHGLQGVIQLYGIESPGWTSSLALGEYIVKNYLSKD